MANELYDEEDFGSKQIGKGATSRADRLAASSAIRSSSGAGDVGGGIASYGAATGNPYALGAGLGLSVLSAGNRRRREDAELKAKMKLERLQRQDTALSRLIGVSQGLRNL